MCEESSRTVAKNKKNQKPTKSEGNKENDILNYKLKQQLPLTRSQIFKQTMNSIPNVESKQNENPEVIKGKMLR